MEILLVLPIGHIISKSQDKYMFYINNYFDWDLVKKLYDYDWIEKDIKNVDIVFYKLELVLIKITNHKLEVANKKR